MFWFQPDPETPAITLRIDLVVEERGLVYITDHKGTGRITSDHAKFYSYSGQFLAFR